MSIRWIPTSAKAYSALREFHNDAMRVHGTITDMGDCTGHERIMTEWGLPGADYPLIKRDDRDGVSSYFIAVITKEDDEA